MGLARFKPILEGYGFKTRVETARQARLTGGYSSEEILLGFIEGVARVRLSSAGGGRVRLALVYHADSPLEARSIAERLEEEGVEADVDEERLQLSMVVEEEKLVEALRRIMEPIVRG